MSADADLLAALLLGGEITADAAVSELAARQAVSSPRTSPGKVRAAAARAISSRLPRSEQPAFWQALPVTQPRQGPYRVRSR